MLALIKVEGCSCGGKWRPLASNLSSKETPAAEAHGSRRVAAGLPRLPKMREARLLLRPRSEPDRRVRR